jgi:hypothetical protein
MKKLIIAWLRAYCYVVFFVSILLMCIPVMLIGWIENKPEPPKDPQAPAAEDWQTEPRRFWQLFDLTKNKPS